MIKKGQQAKCVLIDPSDQISEMAKSQQVPKAAEMHEVYPRLRR